MRIGIRRIWLWAVLVLSPAPVLAQAGPVILGEPELVERTERLLPELEARSGLRSPDTLHVRWTDRLGLQDLVERRLEREWPEPMARDRSRILSLLGLLPPGSHLPTLLRDAQLAEGAGLYDPRDRTILLIQDEPPEVQATTLVHELVHALQDEASPLEELLDPGDGLDGRQAARAVLEAHATLLALERMAGFQPMGDEEPLGNLPELRSLVDDAVDAMAADSEALQGLPAYVRDLLLFPYREGVEYVERLWNHEGGVAPPVPDRLPLSTRDVLHPDPILAGEDLGSVIPPLPSGPDGLWGALGAHTVGVLLRVRGATDSEALVAGWMGDAWFLDEGGERGGWLVVWRSPEEEERFREALRESERVADGAESWTGPHPIGTGGWPATLVCLHASAEVEPECDLQEIFGGGEGS